MVIFDRIGRDSDCSFINSSSEKKPAQIGEAPLAKLTEIHSPRLVQEKSFENQNAFLQRKGPAPRGIITLTCIFIIVIHGLKNIQIKKKIWVISACECPAWHKATATQWSGRRIFSTATRPQHPFDTLFHEAGGDAETVGRKLPWITPIHLAQVK